MCIVVFLDDQKHLLIEPSLNWKKGSLWWWVGRFTLCLFIPSFVLLLLVTRGYFNIFNFFLASLFSVSTLSVWWVCVFSKFTVFFAFLISKTCKVSSHNPFEMKANKTRIGHELIFYLEHCKREGCFFLCLVFILKISINNSDYLFKLLLIFDVQSFAFSSNKNPSPVRWNKCQKRVVSSDKLCWLQTMEKC